MNSWRRNSGPIDEGYSIDNCEPISDANLKKRPIVFSNVDIEVLHKASENYTEPNEPITIENSQKFQNPFLANRNSDNRPNPIAAPNFVQR